MYKHIIQGFTIGNKIRWRCSNCVALNEDYVTDSLNHKCKECGDVSNVMP